MSSEASWLGLAALLIALLIVIPLAFYAGQLLRQLNQQNQKATKVREERIQNITESIQIIAKAMEQQQCNFSEGSIRIFELLKALPVKQPPDYASLYPNMHQLYEHVKDLPTHQARKALSREVRDEQDASREEMESKLESSIIKELTTLKVYQV